MPGALLLLRSLRLPRSRELDRENLGRIRAQLRLQHFASAHHASLAHKFATRLAALATPASIVDRPSLTTLVEAEQLASRTDIGAGTAAPISRRAAIRRPAGNLLEPRMDRVQLL